jgi:hypothetical protein
MGMREEFEAWFMGLLSIDLSSYHQVDEKGVDGYVFDDTNDERTSIATCAFLAWQASRAALVIELPVVPYRQNPDPDTDRAMIERAAIRKACDAAGVSYK